MNEMEALQSNTEPKGKLSGLIWILIGLLAVLFVLALFYFTLPFTSGEKSIIGFIQFYIREVLFLVFVIAVLSVEILRRIFKNGR